MCIDVRMPLPYEIVGSLDDPLGVVVAFMKYGAGGTSVTIRVSDGSGSGLAVRTLHSAGSGEFGGPYAATIPLPTVPLTTDGRIEIYAGLQAVGEPLVVLPIQFGAALMDDYMSFSMHEVVAGESLWSVAEAEYAYGGGGVLWHKIYDANRHQIADPNVIYPGQMLMVPRSTATEFSHA